MRRTPRNRGTLARYARGLSPRPGRRPLESRKLRRVPGSRVRGVPGDPARARSRADGLLHAQGRTLVLGRRGAAGAACRGTRETRGVRRCATRGRRLRPQRHVRVERRHPLVAARPWRRGVDDGARVRRGHTDVGVRRREPRRVRAGRDRGAHRAAHAGDLRLAHHLPDGAALPRERDLRGRACGRRALGRGRRARAGPGSARSRRAGRRHLRGQLPQQVRSSYPKRGTP